MKILTYWYRGFSHYANLISGNFITAIFQNFPKIFALCVFRAIFFITAIFTCTWLMRFWGYLFHYSDLWKICLMPFLANATFSRSQKSHKARTLCTFFDQKWWKIDKFTTFMDFQFLNEIINHGSLCNLGMKFGVRRGHHCILYRI